MDIARGDRGNPVKPHPMVRNKSNYWIQTDPELGAHAQFLITRAKLVCRFHFHHVVGRCLTLSRMADPDVPGFRP